MNEAAMVAIWLHWHRWAQQQLVVLHWGYAYFGCIIDDVHILLVFVLTMFTEVFSTIGRYRLEDKCFCIIVEGHSEGDI